MLLFILLAMTTLVAAGPQTSKGFMGNELFSMRCSGELFMMKDTPAEFSMDLSGMASQIETYISVLYEKVKACDNCPSMTRLDLEEKLNLGNPFYWLNWMLGKRGDTKFFDLETCPQANAEWNWDQIFNRTTEESYWTLPASALPPNDPIMAQLETQIAGLGLGVAVGTCPNSPLPWMTVHCLGDSCEHVGAPCADNTECGTSGECRAMDVADMMVSSWFPDDATGYTWLRDGFIYSDTDDTSPGCFPFSTLVNNVANVVRKSWFGLGDLTVENTNAQKYCVPSGLPTFNAAGFETWQDFTLDFSTCQDDGTPVTTSPTASPTVSGGWRCALSDLAPCTAADLSVVNADVTLNRNLEMTNGTIELKDDVTLTVNGVLSFTGFGFPDHTTIKVNVPATTSSTEVVATANIVATSIIGQPSRVEIVMPGTTCKHPGGYAQLAGNVLTFRYSCQDNQFSPVACSFLVPCQCGFIKPWTGDGINVATMKSSTPSKPWEAVTPDASDTSATVMFKVSCTGQVSFYMPLFDFHFRARFPEFSTFNWIDDILFKIMECRRGGTLDREMFEIAMMYPSAFLAIYDKAAKFNYPIPDVQSYYQQFLPNAGATKVILPNTANYVSWSEKGYIAAQYEGLENLLGVQLNVRMSMSKCPSAPIGAQIYLDCVGAGCKLLGPPIDCSAGVSACPAGGVCRDFSNDLADAGLGFEWPWSASTDYPEQGGCVNETTTTKAWRSVARAMAGSSPDGKTDLKFCSINEFWNVPGWDFNTWTQAQTTTSADEVTLNTVVAWTPKTVGEVTTGSASTLSFILSLSVVAVLFALY